jgi:hypothetical protein
VEAVQQWKFEPGRRYGRPVATHLNLTVGFKLFGAGGDSVLEMMEKAKGGDAKAEFELANAFFGGKGVPRTRARGPHCRKGRRTMACQKLNSKWESAATETAPIPIPMWTHMVGIRWRNEALSSRALND